MEAEPHSGRTLCCDSVAAVHHGLMRLCHRSVDGSNGSHLSGSELLIHFGCRSSCCGCEEADCDDMWSPLQAVSAFPVESGRHSLL